MLYRSISTLFLSLAFGSALGASLDAPGVPNFHRVNDHVFRGGQPGADGWSSLANLGVKLVVDLRPATEHPVQVEERAVAAAGMRYVNVPMKGLGAPETDAVFRVLAFLADPGGSVFVHCKRGSDRTGTVVACYRIQHDHWEKQKALQEARSYGMYRIERGMMHYILSFNPADMPLAASAPVGSSSDLP